MERRRVFDTMPTVTAIQKLLKLLKLQKLLVSLIETSPTRLAAGCGVWLVAMIALQPSSLAQDPFANQDDGIGAPDSIMEPEAALAEAPEQLDWSRNPGAFERALRRRVSNPLFSVERQVVQPSEVKAAKIRDAADARSVLSEFVELSLDRRKLARIKTIEEMDLALARYRTVLRTLIEVGGETESLVEGLKVSRAALIEQWRGARDDDPELLAALDAILESDVFDDPANSNGFAAQLQRENGPILPDELVPALLSESPDTIEVVLAQLPPEQQSETRSAALELIQKLQSLEVELDEVQAKLDLLRARD